MSAEETLRNFRTPKPPRLNLGGSGRRNTYIGRNVSNSARTLNSGHTFIDLVSDDENGAPNAKSRHNLINLVSDDEDEALEDSPLPRSSAHRPSLGRTQLTHRRRTDCFPPKEDQIIPGTPRTKRFTKSASQQSPNVLSTNAFIDSIPTSSQPTASAPLISDVVTPQTSNRANRSSKLNQASSQNTSQPKLSPAPQTDQSIAQKAAPVPIEERSRAFFTEFKNLFLCLVSPENTFFDDLKNRGSQIPFVGYADLQVQPVGINATLKPYQLGGLSWLVWLYRNGVSGILGDQMGLGKTLQILSLFQYLKETEPGSVRTSLVICPKTVLNTWISEAKKFTPNLTVLVVHGAESMRNAKIKTFRALRKRGAPPDLVITSYPTMLRQPRFFTSSFQWSHLVLDEGHLLKNPDAELTKKIGLIKAHIRLAVTGTPLQNRLDELWSLLNILYPAVFTKGSRTYFNESTNIQLVNNARRLLDVVMLRRTEASPEVDLRLPPKRVIRLCVPLSPLQRDCYMMVMSKIAHLNLSQSPSSTRNLEKPSGRALSNMLLSLRRVCSHPFLFQENGPLEELVRASSKFVVLEKLIDEVVTNRGEKIIVFSEWLGCLDLVADLLSVGINGQTFTYLRLDGDTPIARRNLIIELFQQKGPPRYSIMLVSIGAGGQGITLTAATTVVFLEDNWNPQNTLQAEARAHRLGQTRPVTIYKLFTAGTVEEQMLGRIQKKLYLAEKVTEATSNICFRSSQENMVHQSPNSGISHTPIHWSISEMQKIIKRGTKSMGIPNANSTEMRDWSFQEMIDKCEQRTRTEDETDKELTYEEEHEWLQTMERVKTLSFEGQELKRKRKAMEEQPQDLDPRDRRVGKNRVVEINGLSISKASMQCKFGESVPPLVTEKPSQPAKVSEWRHERHCHKCKGDGVVLKCSFCPRVYHDGCTIQATGKRIFTCGQHRCFYCHDKIADAGGMLYRCRDCEKALCTNCWKASTGQLLQANIQEFLRCGYVDTKGAFWFILCSSCNKPPPLQPLEPQSVDDLSSELSTPPPSERGSSPLDTTPCTAISDLTTPETSYGRQVDALAASEESDEDIEEIDIGFEESDDDIEEIDDGFEESDDDSDFDFVG